MSTDIIVTILGGLFMVINSWFLYRIKTKDTEEKKAESNKQTQESTLNQRIENFQRDLMEEKAVATERYNDLLEKYNRVLDENEKLKRKFDSIKNALDSAKTFGYGSSIAMWSKDVQGHRINHNKAYVDLTGYTFKESQYKTDFEITGNRELSKIWRKIDLEVIRTKRAIAAIEPCAHKDNPEDVFFVLSYKWPAWSQGRIIGVEGLAIPLPDILTAIRTSSLDLTEILEKYLGHGR